MHNVTQGALHLAMQITGSRDEALDILQSALVKAMEHGNAPRPEDAGYRAWIYRVVHNQAIDWLRSQKKFDLAMDLESIPDSTDPEQILDLEQRKLLLHKALNILSSEAREIICLKDFHDFSYAEIADIMCIEKGTVMSRLHRARTELKNKLIALKVFPGGDHAM